MNSYIKWIKELGRSVQIFFALLLTLLVSASFVFSYHSLLFFGEAGEVPHRDFPAEEVGQIISPQMGERHLNQPSVFNGYAVLAGNAIHEIWDISNPYQPQFQAEMISQHTAGEAESHQVTYGQDALGNFYLATTSGRGIDIWNVNDMQSPLYLNAVTLPGINYGDVANAVWGLSWQGDYLFVGATSNGVYVVDVSDVLQAELVATISVTDLGGVLAGPLFVVGNLLIVTTPKGNAGIATVDVSDPLQPVVMDYEHFPPKSYIGGFYGKYATLITPFRLIDVTTDPANIQLLHTEEVPKSEYVSFSDGHLFLGGLRGGTQGVYKYDITDPLAPQLIGRVEGRDNRWDDQFSCPLGNLLIICDDQRVSGNYVGGVIAVHAEHRDSVGPMVLHSEPKNGSTNQSLQTKIGFSFTDWIEFASVDESSFVVRLAGGAPIKGSWGCTTTTLTFTPSEPLLEQAKYEVVLPAGGITDLSGNPISETIVTAFTTGRETTQVGQAQLLPVAPIPLGDTADFVISNPDFEIAYEWTTGDGTCLEGAEVDHRYRAPGRYPVTVRAFQTLAPDSIFEAEQASLSGGVNVATTHVPFSGAGYVDYPAGMGEEVKVSWELKQENARIVSLQFSYANGGNTSRPLHLIVNNNDPTLLDFPPTGGWKTWQTISAPSVQLNAGENTITLSASANSVGPNIDYLFLAPDLTIPARRDLVGSQSFIQVVYFPHADMPPQSSSSMQIVDSLLWTLNPDANTLSMLDLNSLEKRGEILVGEHPTALAIGPSHSVWVINRDSWSISIHDRTTGVQRELVNLPFASQPTGLVFLPDGNTVYVSLSARGQVLKLNSLTKEVENTLSFPADAKGRIPNLGALALDAARDQLLLTRFISTVEGGELFAVDANSMELQEVIQLSYDSGTDTDQFSRGLPNYLTSIAISPDGRRAWLPSKKDNIQRGEFRDGLALEHDNTVRSIISIVDLEVREEQLLDRIDLDNSDRSHSASFNQFGDLLFLTLPGNNQVVVVDAYSGKELTRLITEQAPDACLLDPQTGRLFIHNFLSRSISVFDIRRLERSQEGVELLGHIPIVSEEPLTPEVLLGKQLFYHAGSMKLNAEGYMSCASCHLDGGEDGQTWDMSSLGEGFRNTIDLRGRAGMGEGRLHWSANFDEVHDFENQIRSLGAGTGLLTEQDFQEGTRSDELGDPKAGLSVELDALAAYLESLDTYPPSPFKAQDGSLTEEALAGFGLFQELECFFCHAGKQYSNSSSGLRHDIGSLKESSGQRRSSRLLGIDVPGLRGVWSTSPYLHDGSASTLYDVLMTTNTEGKHGRLAELSAEKLDDLLAFLQQLDGDAPAAPDSPWELELVSPRTENIVTTQDPIPLSVTHTLPDLKEVIYYANGSEIGRTADVPFSISWTPNQSGIYELEAKAIHGSNAFGTVSLSKVIKVVRLPIYAEKQQYDSKVFPNPGSGSITIDLGSWYDPLLNVSIFDLNGTKVRQDLNLTKEGGILHLNISSLRSGVYLLRVNGQSGYSWVERLVIQN